MKNLRYQVCKGCRIYYLRVDFLPHRMAGYCTEECWHYEPRGEPSAESVGWKSGIAAPSQRKPIGSQLHTDMPPVTAILENESVIHEQLDTYLNYRRSEL